MKRRSHLLAGIFFSLSAGAMGAFATPSFSIPVSSPTSVILGVPSQVTITTQLTTAPGDRALIAGSVDLLQVSSTGQLISTLGVMHDDGLNGDAVAGDGTFSLVVTLTETSTSAVLLQATGAFQGSPLRTKSPVGSLSVLALDMNAILGFETPAAWMATGTGGTTSTTTRTQGSFAYAVSNPTDPTTLTSMQVSSTATGLAGASNIGSMFEVDVLPPSESGNVSAGALQLSVSSASLGLNSVVLGSVNLATFRPGIYSTLAFPIPDNVRSALSGPAFTDLVFQFRLTSPGAGTYLFDNLRAHSVPLVTTDIHTVAPPGYGGSIDLAVTGNTPVSQSFNAGPIQVPNAFHLKTGTAGGTTVQLEYGYAAGTPAVTCLYSPDTSDPTGKSYIFTSCTGVFQPGDLIGASWAQLAILNGASTLQMLAQLATNPVGDMVGGGVIPVMPTYWGATDGCSPTPVKGTVVTVSASCTAQIAEANQIVNNYFNGLNSSTASPNWVVAPVPAWALHAGDGAPIIAQNPPPPYSPAFPFDQEGHVNQGGSWDAYWRLNGDLDAQTLLGSDQTTTSFDATFGAHLVLDGDDVDVVSVEFEGATSTGESTPVILGPSATGSVHLFLFGEEIPTGGIPFGLSSGSQTLNLANFNLDESPLEQDFDLPPVQVWIFQITIGAVAKVGFTAVGGFGPSGVNMVFTPNASLGAHIQGTVSIIIASGGVDAELDLMTVGTPLTINAQWAFNFDPAVCAADLTGTLDASETFGTLGGEIDLIATFGICPFCKDEKWPILKWDPISVYTRHLFTSPIANAAPLPVSRCSAPLAVTIFNPLPSGAYPANSPISLSGLASVQPNGTSVPCNDLKWTITANSPGDTAPAPVTGCTPIVTFAQPSNGTSSSYTVNLSATESFVNPFNTITETGTATPVPITITELAAGDYVTQLTDAHGNIFTPSFSMCLGFQFCLLGNGPSTYTIQGLVTGAPGPTSTSFIVTDSNNVVTGLATINPTSATPSAVWTPPIIGGFNSGQYTITMTTTVNGNPYATTNSVVFFSVLE
jgi:hypothetical protein